MPEHSRAIRPLRAASPLAGWTLAGLAAASQTVSLQAEGLRNPPPGAFALGRAGSRAAHVEDSSAITHNPANLTRIGDLDATLSLMAVHISVDYEGPAGSANTVVLGCSALPDRRMPASTLSTRRIASTSRNG